MDNEDGANMTDHKDNPAEENQENPLDDTPEKEDLKENDNLMEDENIQIDDVQNNDEYAQEIEDEFRREIAVDKEEEAKNEEELYLRMKRRIIKSFRWQEDLIIPFSKELKMAPEELEEILINRLDMSSLEALNPRFESSKYRCTKERVHSDLKLCWLADVMNLLTVDEAEDIKNRITTRIVHQNVKYEDAIEEGRIELVEYLKRK